MVHIKGFMYKWIMQDLGESGVLFAAPTSVVHLKKKSGITVLQ